MADIMVQAIAALGIVVIAVLFYTEVRRWQSITSIIGRRQRIVRTWLIVLIEVLFAMVFVGPWITARKDPISALLYWTICITLGLSVVVLALYDLKHIAREYGRQNRRMFSDLRGQGERKK